MQNVNDLRGQNHTQINLIVNRMPSVFFTRSYGFARHYFLGYFTESLRSLASPLICVGQISSYRICLWRLACQFGIREASADYLGDHE
jgi:hypothetical protein